MAFGAHHRPEMFDCLDAIELSEARLRYIFKGFAGGIRQKMEVEPDHRSETLCITMGTELADSAR